MPGDTKIEWTTARIVDRHGRRVREYARQDPDRPGQQLRRRLAAFGLKWCRACAAWRSDGEMNPGGGLCKEHDWAAYKQRYAEDGTAIRERARARKRGLRPLTADAIALLREWLGTDCLYCGGTATTWDHVLAVVRGGQTEPGNIAPACVRCNSSKKDRLLFDEWQPPDPSPVLFDLLALEYC